MSFISPKIDYAFKKIFGSHQSEKILISFLNAIIYDGEKIIDSLTIVNPFNPGQIISFKDTYLDVKAVLVDGSIVVIEMQVARMTAFNKRVAYNLAKAYARTDEALLDVKWRKYGTEKIFQNKLRFQIRLDDFR